ncbi:pmr1, partial [Symbiodinium sp. KB8]
MGSGTEVAKQAAHMVLLNDDLASVVQAMREGKGTFFNIRNFCRFQLSTSVAALGLVAITTMLGLPAPLSPMQVLFINVIMDGFPAISLGVEPVPRDVMQQPPRPRAEPIVTRGLMSRVLMAGVLMLLGTLLVYVQELSADGQVTTRDTTMTFATFVLFDMFNAAASRSATNSIFTLGVTSNRMFNIAVAGSLTALALLVYAPPLQAVFRTEGLSLLDWAVVKRCNDTDQWPVPRWLLGVEDWSGEDDAQQSVGLPEPCTRCMHDLMCCLRMRGLRRVMGWDPLPSEDPSEPRGSGRELEGPSTPHAGAGM